jgi:hypothetical protein
LLPVLRKKDRRQSQYSHKSGVRGQETIPHVETPFI